MFGRMQESGRIEIIASISTSAIWGQHPVLFHPEFPQWWEGGWNVMDWWLQHPLFTNMAETFFFSLKTAVGCCQYQTSGARGLGAGEPGPPRTVASPAAGKLWQHTLEMQEHGCIHSNSISLCSHAAWNWKTFSMSRCRTPSAQENCETAAEPPLPDLLKRATPNLPGLPPECWPLGPLCPEASPLHRADLQEGMAREQGCTGAQEASWAFTLKH